MNGRLFERLIANRRAVLLALSISTGLAIVGICRLQFEESTRDVLYSSPETSALLDKVERSFGSDQHDCYVILQSDPIFSSEGLAVLREFVARVKEIEGTAFVYSMLDVRRQGRIRLPLIPSASAPQELIDRRLQEALQHPLVEGYLLSTDAQATLIAIRLEGSRLNIEQMLRVVDPLREILAEVTRDTSVRGVLTGLTPINCEIVKSIKWVMVWFGIAATVVCLLISLFIFRSASAAIMTFTAPLVGCLWALGLLSMAGIKFNVVHSIMPTLVVATGFSDAVHLMYHFRNLLRQGVEKQQAVTQTVSLLGPACALTSMTTAVGFGSLAISSLPVVRIFGLACALGCGLTFVSVIITFVVATEWFPFPWSPTEQRQIRVGATRGLSIAFSIIARHARLITVCSVICVVLLCPLFLKLRPDYQYASSLPVGSEAVESLRLCDRLFGGCLGAQVLVTWDESHDSPQAILPAVVGIHDVLEAEPALTYPVSVLTFLQAITRDANVADDWYRLDRLPADAINRLIRFDHRTLLVVARMTDQGSQRNSEAIARVREGLNELREQHSGLTIDLTGIAPMAFDSVNQIIRDLSGCLIVASIVIFVVLTISFRSIGLGMISVIPNAFPVVALAAILFVTHHPLTYVSVLVFTIALGIAVDDTIHFIFRYKGERRAGSTREVAAKSAYLTVGPAMLTTTAIFVASFASLRISVIPQHHSLAMLCGISMLLALLGDLLILPALLLAREKPPSADEQSATEVWAAER